MCYLTLLATACMARALSTESRQHDLTAPAILPPATGGEDAGDAVALQVRPAALHRTKGGGTERKGIDVRACRGQRRRRSTCPHLKVPPLCHPAATQRQEEGHKITSNHITLGTMNACIRRVSTHHHLELSSA